MIYDVLFLSIDTNYVVDSNDSATSINSSNTFYTKGLLSTVLYPSYADSSNLSGQNDTLKQQFGTIFYIDNIPKLISGTWSLNVSEGSVINFDTSFKFLSVNGIEKHYVEISNFQNSSPVTFKPFSNTVIDGLADIKIDNKLLKSQFPLSIQISKINTITITIQDGGIGDIFFNREILGITDSFKNFRNDELLILEDDE